MEKQASKPAKIILYIGWLKLLKGVLLLALAFGLFGLIRDSWAAEVERWIRELNADAHVRFFEKLLARISSTSDREYFWLGFSAVVYSGLFFLEGIGLILRKRWAELLTVIITASFLPLEIYETVERFNDIKLGLLAFNVAIVVYLIWLLRRQARQKVS